MKYSSLTLYLEINNLNYVFFVGEYDEQNNFKVVYKLKLPLKEIENNKILDLEKISNLIKNNVYIVEQKFNYIFKEVVLILENFDLTFLNLSGYKRLNGSQILRENIIYILNTSKSCVDETESKKNILHIFNSKFNLDNKKVENLPIGLFGDFYSHELSFALIDSDEYKNLKNIFDKANLNIKKILLKSFIEGVKISDTNRNTDTFFLIKINNNNSKIIYFENNSLKFEQYFQFGTDIILKDISKITSLELNTIKMIISKLEFTDEEKNEELIEKSFFAEDKYIKIKKKLILEIASARIKEISELIIFKNINLKYFTKLSKVVFLEINDNIQLESFKDIYKNVFSSNGNLDLNFLDNLPNEKILETANKLVKYGWKKEAIPITLPQKSLIGRLFDSLFS